LQSAHPISISTHTHTLTRVAHGSLVHYKTYFMYLYNVCIYLDGVYYRVLVNVIQPRVCVCGNTFDASCNTNLLCILFYFLLSTTILLLLRRWRASRCFYYYSNDYFNSYHIFYYNIIMYAKYNTIRALLLYNIVTVRSCKIRYVFWRTFLRTSVNSTYTTFVGNEKHNTKRVRGSGMHRHTKYVFKC